MGGREGGGGMEGGWEGEGGREGGMDIDSQEERWRDEEIDLQPKQNVWVFYIIHFV